MAETARKVRTETRHQAKSNTQARAKACANPYYHTQACTEACINKKAKAQLAEKGL
jgi:hypothetical protein